MIRRRVPFLVAALVLGSAGLAPMSTASATTTCLVGQITANKTSTYADAGECYAAQARIDRYSNSVVYTYLGPVTKFSTVGSSVGVNAGNAGRVKASSGSSWTVWTWCNFGNTCQFRLTT